MSYRRDPAWQPSAGDALIISGNRLAPPHFTAARVFVLAGALGRAFSPPLLTLLLLLLRP